MGAAVVAGGDAAPVLQAAKHVLDAMALAVERPVIGQRLLTRTRGRDARGNTAFFQRGPEPSAVVAAVAQQLTRLR